MVNCGFWETVSNGNAGEGVGTTVHWARVVSMISLPSLIPNCRIKGIVLPEGVDREIETPHWLVLLPN